MKELIESALAGGLKELAGLELSGTIPIKQELINDAIAGALEKKEKGESPAPPAPAPHPRPPVDVAALLPHVKHAEIRAEGGRLTVIFEIKIDA